MEFCLFRPSVLSSFYWIELADSKVTDGKDKQIFSYALTLTNTRREHNCMNSISLASKTKTEVFIWTRKAEQPGFARLSARALSSVNQCGGQWSSSNLHQFGSPSSILDESILYPVFTKWKCQRFETRIKDVLERRISRELKTHKG